MDNKDKVMAFKEPIFGILILFGLIVSNILVTSIHFYLSHFAYGYSNYLNFNQYFKIYFFILLVRKYCNLYSFRIIFDI